MEACNSRNTKPHGFTFHAVLGDGVPALRLERLLERKGHREATGGAGASACASLSH